MKREINSQRSWKGPLNSSKKLSQNSENSVSTCATHILLVHLWGHLGLTLPLDMVPRWEQAGASAAGAGAELGGGPEGRGRQRRGWAQPAAGAGPPGRVQSRPGGTLLWAAPPAGAQRPRWGHHSVCSSTLANLGKCRLWPFFFLSKNIPYLHPTNPSIWELEQSDIKVSRSPWT